MLQKRFGNHLLGCMLRTEADKQRNEGKQRRTVALFRLPCGVEDYGQASLFCQTPSGG